MFQPYDHADDHAQVEISDLEIDFHCHDSRQPFSFVTTEVVEATCQCLLAQAEEAERKSLSEVENEAMVIEEFGRCLKQIIEIAKKTGSGGSGGGGGCSFDS